MRRRDAIAPNPDPRAAGARAAQRLGWLGLALIAAQARGQTLATDCSGCHVQQGEQLHASVHDRELRCQDCHGGASEYEVSANRRAALAAALTQPGPARGGDSFDHGPAFRGKSARRSIPELCGTCHADVARMNPYGLKTDQLASYWLSGHGKRLKSHDDDRVAVCTDCHGTHDILRHDSPKSRTYFQNVIQTCGHCHADAALMTAYNRSAEVVEQYKHSVHGRNVLDRGDSGSPTCVSCHGSHAAAPPGYLDVGHVCGKCHQQIEQYFSSGTHGRVPLIRRCVGCHADQGQRGNHLIREASPAADELVRVFREVRAAHGDGGESAQARFVEQVDALPDSLRLESVCNYCHGSQRVDPHAQFYQSNDQRAQDQGRDLAQVLQRAQFDYARLAERVERLGHGVLLVRSEALRVEDARTELMALYAQLHTLDSKQVHETAAKLKGIFDEVHAALDLKELGLTRRHQAVALAWVLIAVFFVAMYRKYQQLRSVYVRKPVAAPAGQVASAPCGAAPPPTRRRALDNLLRALGGVGVLALIWPALAYMLPGRKRGSGAERANAGKLDGWANWEMRKVAVGGVAVGVVRTEGGFRAVSLVCTHLGCIVRWNAATREFDCPCHAARFDVEGRVLAGPPPKPLPVFHAVAVQGEVVVSKAAG